MKLCAILEHRVDVGMVKHLLKQVARVREHTHDTFTNITTNRLDRPRCNFITN